MNIQNVQPSRNINKTILQREKILQKPLINGSLFFFLNDHLQSKDIFFHFYPIVQMYTLNSQLYNKEEKWWVLQCKRSSILLDFYDKWLPDKYIISICKKKILIYGLCFAIAPIFFTWWILYQIENHTFQIFSDPVQLGTNSFAYIFFNYTLLKND